MNHFKPFLIVFLFIISSICVFAQTESVNPLKNADNCFAQGVALYNKGEYHEAQVLFEQCEQIEASILPDSLPKRAYPKMWIAACHYKLGDTITAQAISKYYYYPIDRRLTIESDSIAEIGNRCFAEGNFDNAIKHYQACAIIEKEKIGAASPWYGNSMINIINAQTYNLFINSNISFDCINECLEELGQVYLSNGVFLNQTIDLFSNTIQPIRNFVFNNAKSILQGYDGEFPFDGFYTNLINLYQCTKDAALLGNTDEYYGRAVEEYANALMLCGQQEKAIGFLSNTLKTCNIKRQINANSIIIELSMGRICPIEKGKKIYSNVFETIERTMDFESIPVRIWVEDRIVNGQWTLKEMGLNHLVVEIAIKCSNAASFSFTENLKFSMLLATLYEEAKDYDIALEIYSRLCDEISLKDFPNDYQPFLSMAKLEEAMGNYQEAIQIYKQIEYQASLSLFDKIILYEHLSDCYNSINDKENCDIYSDKLITYLHHSLETDFSEDNIDRTIMNTIEVLEFDNYKQSIIKKLLYLYYQHKDFEKAKALLDYAYSYYCLIKDYRECVGVLLELGQRIYGYNGYQNAEKANSYLFQAISLCDSLDNTIDLKELYLGEGYASIAFIYESLSAEPELALDYFEEAVEHLINAFSDIINSTYYPSETEQLIGLCWDLLNHDIEMYGAICTDLGIQTDFVSKSYFRIADLAGDILPEEEQFELLYNAYQLDIDMCYFSYLTNYKANASLDQCKSRIRDIERLFKRHKNSVTTHYFNVLAEDYLIIGDTTYALDNYTKAAVLYQANPSNDYFDLSDYLTSIKGISKIKGDREWIDVCISKLVNDSAQYDPQRRLKNINLAIQELGSVRYEYELEGKEKQEFYDYLVEFETKFLNDYGGNSHLGKNSTIDEKDIAYLYDKLLYHCVLANRYDVLKDYYSECFDVSYEGLIQALSRDPWSGRIELWNGLGLGEALSLAYPDQSFDNGRVFDGISLRKSANLSVSIALSNLIKETSDSLLYAKYYRTERLKNAIRSNDDPVFDQGRMMSRDEALRLIDRFESEIREKSQYVIDYSSSLRITWKEIQSSLNHNEAAIEFSKFSDLQGRVQYAAVILRSTGVPIFVYLFDENTLLDITRKENLITEVTTFNLIWKPIFEHLQGIQTLFVSPDGELQRIPFEYVLYDGKPLIEKYNIHRVSSTRLLASRKDYQRNDIHNIALFGGIDFDSVNTTGRVESTLALAQDRARIKEANYLPGTLDEVESIRELCRDKPITVVSYIGTEGSESNFKRLSNNNVDIIHLATHGYYIPNDTKISLVYASKNDSLVTSKDDLTLLRSGLLMAGANYYDGNERSIDFEDGVLTAYEIAMLDLHKTDFVVLSACETGLGDISTEGVFGLSRGLKKAGANCIMMSLWKVNDNATKAMMSKFYEYYLSGLSKYESLKLSQEFVRSHTEKGWDDPKYWAAFILLDGLD